MTYDEAYEKALAGKLNAFAEEWEMRNAEGKCLAVQILWDKKEVLHDPEKFDRWDIWLDEYNETLAHYAALFHWLPKKFNQWTLINRDRQTVAHSLAEYLKDNQNFPADFHQWGLLNQYNRTVFECLVTNTEGNKRALREFADWDLVVTSKGETCSDIYECMTGGKYEIRRSGMDD